MTRNTVSHAPRQVIDERLLAALDDKTKVALLLNEDDLDLLLWALGKVRAGEREDNKAVEMYQDLSELKKSAFGES